MKTFTLKFLVVFLLILIGIVSGEIVNVYNEEFSASSALEEIGFCGISYWELDQDLGAMKTTTPGGWFWIASINTPSFPETSAATPVTVSWKVMLPANGNGRSWRENNKIWVSLMQAGEPRYTLLWKPNRAQDQDTSYDLRFIKKSEDTLFPEVVADGWTHTVTPVETWLQFSILFQPDTENGGDGSVLISYDCGEGMQEYLYFTEESYRAFDTISISYKTGRGNMNYSVLVDDLKVAIELPDEDPKGDPKDDGKKDDDKKDEDDSKKDTKDEVDETDGKDTVIVPSVDPADLDQVVYNAGESEYADISVGGMNYGQWVNVIIRTLDGRLVRRLSCDTGYADHVLWDYTDMSGKPVSTGMYLYTIRSESSQGRACRRAALFIFR